MKQEETTQALQQNFFQEKSKFEIVEEKLKNTIFGVLNILLKFDDDSFYGEVLSLINETCQFLYYPFYDPMGYLWKKDSLFNTISKTLSYFQTVVFFNNTQLYIVVFYILILLIVLVVLDIIYVSYSISSKNKAGAVWPMRLLRSVVSFIVTVMFNPMVEFLLAILECSDTDENGNELGYYQNYNVDDMHCWTNTHFTVMVVLSILTTVIFVIICTVVQTIFYETKTSDKADGAKTNSRCDLVSLAVKIALIIIYSFLVWKQKLHWIVVPLTLFCGFIQFYVYWVERPFYEEIMNTAFLIHTGIFFWSTIVLFLVKVLETTSFDGGIFVFIIGTPIVVFIIVTQKDRRFSLLLQNINKFENGESVFKQIRYFLELVDKKYKDRKSNILLKGYIYLHEEYCTLPDCPLKKYLKECEKSEKTSVNVNVNGTQTGYGMESVNNLHTSGAVLTQVGGGTTLLNTANSTSLGQVHSEADLYLFQHALLMYQNGISKFPSCTSLRMNYAFFLMERMNNSKKSLIELKNCEKYDPSFEEQFIIFRFHQNQGGDEDDGDDDEGLDIVSNIAYNNYFTMFKECLTNITEIYTEFWNLLLNHSQKSEEDLTKMNEYGEKINKLIEEIKVNYEEMEKLKYNDEEVLTLYSDFFQDILNDNTQAEYYRSRLRDIQGNAVLREGDKREANEVQGLPVSDEFEYIFLSAEASNIGTIIKISLGICKMFGYSQSDLVGKKIDEIMPDMYQELHKQVLVSKYNKYTHLVNQKGVPKGGGKGSYREIFAFGKDKMKYLVPLAMKVTLLSTQDQNELFFASRIMNDDLYNDINIKTPTPGVPSINNFNMKVCYVLTDLNFIVQYFTLNAIAFLGFKSNAVGNIDITKSISDLNNNEERFDVGKMSKSEVFKKKYFDPKVIIWKTLLNEEEEQLFHVESTTGKLGLKGIQNYTKKIVINTNPVSKTLSSSKSDSKKNSQFMPIRRQRYKEDFFMLGVTEINIMGQGVGYVFRFEVTDMEDNDLDGYDDKDFFTNDNIPLSNNQTNNSQAELNPSYIPEINKKFELDTRKLAFIPTKVNNSSDSSHSNNTTAKTWHAKCKEFAMEKVNKFKEQMMGNNEQEEEENEEEESEIDSEEESREYSSSYNSVVSSEEVSSSHSENGKFNQTTEDKKKIQSNKTLAKQNTKQTNLSNSVISQGNKKQKSIITKQNTLQNELNYEFSYYHVKSISAIKFSIYDFKKKKMVDVPQIKRESQVEYKKKEQLPDFSSRKVRRRETNSEHKGEKNEHNEDNANEDEENNQIDAVLVKQIEYALRKEEFQPEIMKLKWISFLTYASLIVITSILLTLFISNIKSTRENLQMISDLHQLISNVISGIYYVRELVLLNNDQYSTSLFSKEASYENITNSIEDLFKASYSLQQNILTTSTKMSHNRKNLLLEGTTNVSMIEDDLDTKDIELTVNTAVTQAFTSLYQIKNTPLDKIIPTKGEVYYYMRNSLDPIITNLKNNMNNFMDEYNDMIKSYKTEHLYIIIAICCVLIISGIATKIMYDLIIQRKSSYLEVFFEIDDNVSKKALDKCDNYAKVLHPLVGAEVESFEEDDDVNDNERKKLNTKVSNDSSRKNKERKTDSYQNIIFVFGVGIVFTCFLAYYLAVILSFQSNLDKMDTFSELYNITSFQSHNYLLVFDKLREYFFNPDAMTSTNVTIKEDLEYTLNEIYNYQKEESEKFDANKLPGKFKKVYQKINKDNLCEYTRDLFTANGEDNLLVKNGFNCSSFTGNSSEYGIGVLVSYYIEESRIQKYYYDLMLQTIKDKNEKFNNYLYGTEFYEGNNTVQNNVEHPIQIFNRHLVLRLKIIRKYYIEPVYKYLIEQFMDSITKFWDNCNTLYIALLIILLIGLTGFYLLYWKPFEIKLDKDIYKTKNMLSIIPKEVIASLKNINTLLNLGTNTINSSSGGKDQIV